MYKVGDMVRVKEEKFDGFGRAVWQSSDYFGDIQAHLYPFLLGQVL